MINKQISQAQQLFPKLQYPTHRAYIDLFVSMLNQDEMGVLERDIEILSIGLGYTTHKLFQSVAEKGILSERTDALLFGALKLKIEVKKRVAEFGVELLNDSNHAVVDLVFTQYNVKPEPIKAPKHKTIINTKLETVEKTKVIAEEIKKRLLDKALQSSKQQSEINLTDIVKAKTIQARALFPEDIYPNYRKFIDFLLQQVTSDPLRISFVDMEKLSSALGSEELALFANLNNHKTIEEKLKHIVFGGLQLKISVKKRLKDTGNELTTNSDLFVIKEIEAQYQSKLEAIEAQKQRELEIKRQAIEVERRAVAAAKLKAEQEAEVERKKHFSDFPKLGLKNIPKHSRTEELLQKLMARPIRIDEKKWLDCEGIVSDLIDKKYHLQLAHQHFQNWKQKSLPWELVNASAAYRKAEELAKIKKALDDSYPFNIPKNEKKLKSALLTTYGGVCRDLKDYMNSIKLGLEAHKVTPLSFRPCTLLGAVYLSTGEFDLGHEWYDKAKERGFSQDAYDNDIKSVYFRASDEMKNRLKQNLIATGHKYKWL
ncbi:MULTISPECIES: cell envelope integrity protein TolA [Pseudomonadati]|uniref:Cell envelope integrity protein TolA n=1 Tax=Shewanella aestuarii TaxID=1028752 RepID=A0ABT0L396_9GAMM|nr:cell envelope integrity protein TolA [Shewanella aestuarii]MCL1117721.1 cell envelope integrity protein TolA [Shewanella aestuarii]GGN76633.1 hypothetical protein GCM10009193_18150 [Shewanella aestuarii]